MFEKMPGAAMDYDRKRFGIHLAQVVHVLTPLLQTNEMFSTWKELTSYLKNNEDNIQIVSEYEIEYTADEFIQMIEEGYKEGKRRMIEYPEMRNHPSYYEDADGYEWCELDFE